jgi:hypothetical protein
LGNTCFKVWHKGLLFKLKLTGVNKQLISWIESYLSDRQQKVVSEHPSEKLLLQHDHFLLLQIRKYHLQKADVIIYIIHNIINISK